MNAPTAAHDDHSGGHMSTYVRVIVTLAVATLIEFAIAYFIDPQHNSGTRPGFFMVGVLALIAIAAYKAWLVARVFMHLKYDPRILSLLAITPVVLGTPLVALGVFDGVYGYAGP